MSRVSVAIVVTVFVLVNMMFTLYVLLGGEYFTNAGVQAVYIGMFVGMWYVSLLVALSKGKEKIFTGDDGIIGLISTLMAIHSAVVVMAHYHRGVGGMSIESWMVWVFVGLFILLELLMLWISQQDMCIRLTDE